MRKLCLLPAPESIQLQQMPVFHFKHIRMSLILWQWEVVCSEFWNTFFYKFSSKDVVKLNFKSKDKMFGCLVIIISLSSEQWKHLYDAYK